MRSARLSTIQRAIDQDFEFDIRIGVHTDGALKTRENYHGKGVHAAARIGAAAEGREILTSQATVERAGAVRGDEPALADAEGLQGTHRRLLGGVGRRRVKALAAATLALTLLLAACGGEDPASVSTVTTTVTTTVTETETVTEAAPTGTSEQDEPGSSTATFQMPSRNIGCLFGFETLRCDILSGLDPEPTEACEFDWVGVDLGVTGAAAANCGSDTVYDADAPTLAYGETWSRDGIRCESEESGLTCTNADGHEFSLARGSWSAS